MNKLKPLVSVNIPTYNSERTLEECLHSVKNQTYPYIEIIIIDSYSKDRTLEIAKDYGAQVFFADSLSEARKVGIKNSRGKYIFFLDSDQYIESKVIQKCLIECEKNGHDAITLFEKSLIEKNTFVEKIIAYDKWLFHSQEDDDAIYGTAIPRFFKAYLFENITWPKGLLGFEHNIIYHEVAKQDANVKFIKDLHIYHHEVGSFSKVFKKFYRYGHSYIPALGQDRKLVFFHSMPRRIYFTKKAFDKPLYLVGLFVLYFIKIFAAGIGIISYVFKKMWKK